MPVVLTRKDSTGEYFLYDTGSKQVIRRATDDDIDQSTLPRAMIDNVQGVTGYERWLGKNWTSSPAAMKALYKSWDYEVRNLPHEYGEWNFAVRRHEGAPWRVVDPLKGPTSKEPFDAFWEKVYDVTDIGSDIVRDILIGAGTVAGGAGGLFGGTLLGMVVGAAAGGAAAATAAEGTKQMIGAALGVPPVDQFSPKGILAEGAVGAAAGAADPFLAGAGRVAGRTLRNIGAGAMEIGAKMVGLPSTQALAAPFRLLSRSRMGPASMRLPSTVEGAQQVRGILRSAFEDAFPEKQIERHLMNGPGGEVPVNMRYAVDRLRRFITPGGGGDPTTSSILRREPDVAKDAAELLGGVYSVMAEDGVADLGRVPMRTAIKIQDYIDDMAREWGFQTAKGTTAKGAITAEAGFVGKDMKALIGEAADTAGVVAEDVSTGQSYSFAWLREQIAAKTNLKYTYQRHFGLERGMREQDGVSQAASFLENIYGSHASNHIDALADIEARFGLEPGLLTDLALKTRLGLDWTSALGPGVARFIPRWTATGQFLGPSLIAGGAFGGSLLAGADPTTAAALGAGGFLLASPRSILAQTRLWDVAGRKAILPFLNATTSPAARVAAIGALREAGTAYGLQAKITEDSRPKRKPVVLGGL